MSTRRPIYLCAALLAVSSAMELNAQTPSTFIVESPTMRTGEMMPRKYSPDGPNLSPPIPGGGYRLKPAR